MRGWVKIQSLLPPPLRASAFSAVKLKNKKATVYIFRGLTGVFVFYFGKKLIESPLRHGCFTPCRPQNALNGEELHDDHGMNII